MIVVYNYAVFCKMWYHRLVWYGGLCFNHYMALKWRKNSSIYRVYGLGTNAINIMCDCLLFL